MGLAVTFLKNYKIQEHVGDPVQSSEMHFIVVGRTLQHNQKKFLYGKRVSIPLFIFLKPAFSSDSLSESSRPSPLDDTCTLWSPGLLLLHLLAS